MAKNKYKASSKNSKPENSRKPIKGFGGLTLGEKGIEYDENAAKNRQKENDKKVAYTRREPSNSNRTPSGIRAPYNFVPFSDTVLFPYANANELPSHEIINTELNTGEIHVVLTAETPVLVSRGNDQKNIHFFRNGKNRYTIPGSTIHGLIRENCQILGFGKVDAKEDFEDYHIIFRGLASKDKTLRDKYGEIVTTTDACGIVSSKANAGYIYTDDGRNYRIYPVKSGDIIKIKRDSRSLDYLKSLTKKVKDPKTRKYKDVPKYTDDRGNINEQIIPVSYTGPVAHAVFEEGESEKSPTLLCTGRSISNPPNCHYLFPAPIRSGKYIEVKPEDILDYRSDYEARRTVLKNKQFWDLPKKGSKPIFYIEDRGHIYFGMSKFLRIGYPYKISQGLPKEHKAANNGIDYPHAVLGYTDGNKAYLGRVSVGDFTTCTDNAIEMVGKQITPASPKPSWYKGYLEPTGRYTNDDFRLRGYKQYWLKEENVVDTGNENSKIKTTIYPLLPKDTKNEPVEFKGVIRFRNLNDMELGLLLWAIRLNKNCYHTVGMGKAFGLGRMSAEIMKLNVLKTDRESYLDFGSPWESYTHETKEKVDEKVKELISEYNKNALGTGEKVSERGEIADFFYMKSKIREDAEKVSYMSLDEYSDVKDWLPTVREIRQKDDEWQKKGII